MRYFFHSSCLELFRVVDAFFSRLLGPVFGLSALSGLILFSSLFLTSSSFYVSDAHSQELTVLDEFKFDETAQKAFKSLTAGLTALTSADSISGGRFSLDADGSEDADIDVLKLWNEFPLSLENPNFIPLLELSFSYLQFKQNLDSGAGENDIDNWGVGAGIGVRMSFFEEMLQITPRIKTKYAEYDFSASLENSIDEEIVNSVLPEIDAWSYLPSLEVQLQPFAEEDRAQPIFATHLTYLYVDAESITSSLSDFESESWIWRNTLSLETSSSWCEALGEVFLRPEVARVDLYGDARDGFALNNFYELGLDVFSRTLGESLFAELGIGLRYVFEDEIHGWRVGVFGDFT